MKNFMKIPFTIDSHMSVEEMTAEFDKRIDNQKYMQFHKLKGSPLLMYRREGNVVKITRYRSYKKDFAGPVFLGEIRKGLNYATLDGNLTKTKGYYILAIAILASYIIDLIIASYMLIFTPETTFISELPVLLATLAIRVYIAILLFRFEKDEIKDFNTILNEICTANDKPQTEIKPEITETDEVNDDERD